MHYRTEWTVFNIATAALASSAAARMARPEYGDLNDRIGKLSFYECQLKGTAGHLSIECKELHSLQCTLHSTGLVCRAENDTKCGVFVLQFVQLRLA